MKGRSKERGKSSDGNGEIVCKGENSDWEGKEKGKGRRSEGKRGDGKVIGMKGKGKVLWEGEGIR